VSIDLDETKVARDEFGMWLGWTLATTFGMLVGYLPSFFLVNIVDLGLARLIVPVLAGLLIGFSQWVVLRRYVSNISDWILAGGAGWAVGYIFGLFVINSLIGLPLGGFLGYVLFGVIVAVAQWPILSREIPNLLTWVVANVAGWTLGFYASQLSLNLFEGPAIAPALSVTLVSTVSGLIAGAITGIALVWIVRQPDRI
jgi:hypothetical protein